MKAKTRNILATLGACILALTGLAVSAGASSAAEPSIPAHTTSCDLATGIDEPTGDLVDECAVEELPPAPVILAPAPHEPFDCGSLVRVEGTAQPGTVVTVYVARDGLGEYIELEPRADGTWEFLVMDSGIYGVHALATDPDTGLSGSPSETVPFTICLTGEPTYSMPAAPKLDIDPLCDEETVILIPNDPNFAYDQTRNGDVVTVTAVPNAGITSEPTATLEWSFVIPAVVPCAGEPTDPPEAPKTPAEVVPEQPAKPEPPTPQAAHTIATGGELASNGGALVALATLAVIGAVGTGTLLRRKTASSNLTKALE